MSVIPNQFCRCKFDGLFDSDKFSDTAWFQDQTNYTWKIKNESSDIQSMFSLSCVWKKTPEH